LLDCYFLRENEKDDISMAKSYDVFISYSGPDRPQAEALAQGLKSHGVEVFLDQWEIRFGDNIIQKLQEGLNSARFYLVIFGETPERSWAAAEREALMTQAIATRRRVIPIKIGDSVIPPEFQSRQYIELKQGLLGIERAVDSIVEVMAQAAEPPPRIHETIADYLELNPDRLRGDLLEARARAELILAESKRLDNKGQEALALFSLGRIAQEQGDYSTARSLYERALATFQLLDDQRAIAATLHQLGIVAQEQGDYSTARSLYERALATFQLLDDQRAIAATLHQLGIVAQEQGDYSTAHELLGNAMRIREEMGDRLGIASELSQLGALRTVEGVAASGVPLNAASHGIRRSLGSDEYVVDLQWLGRQRELLGEREFESILSESIGSIAGGGSAQIEYKKVDRDDE
jgi:tetratricopeptide (TPR) repeat protein